MTDNDSVSDWLHDVKEGDPEALRKLWNRYFRCLTELGQRNLGRAARRTVDGEDVALSALDSFFQGARKGKYPDLDDRDNLWKLLVVITKRKASDYNKYATAKKRGSGKVQGESALERDNSSGDTPGIHRVIAEEPTPEFLKLLNEQCQLLLDQIADEKARAVAELRLAGYDTIEIAQHLQVAPRTVERKSMLVRSIWSQEITQSN